MPDDYPLFTAARHLGVSPWSLAEQPTYWRDRAVQFANAEHEAQKDKERRKGRGGGKRGKRR